MQVFYSQHINEDSALFSEDESKHALQVLRLKTGDKICIINGEGSRFEGVVNYTGKKEFTANQLQLIEHKNAPTRKIHLYISPTKNADRIEWLLEKIVEIGVWSFTPVICERTVKTGANLKRFNNIALSAMKQSLRLHRPIIREPIELSKFTFHHDIEQYCFGFCGEEEKTTIQNFTINKNNIGIFIGPEGDFTNKETNFFKSNQVVPVTFGSERLRTETAGLVAVTYMKYKTG